ncbi:MAG: hypothetical protein E7369_02460 [Clostridiales bacterium]|nr:hypothetical protein [Clostridiales bacterium]
MKDKLLNKVKSLRVGFYLLVLALITAIIGFGSFLITYDIFGFQAEKLGITLTVLSFWFLAFMLFNAFYKGNNPKWTWVIFAVVVLFLVVAMIKFLAPCLSPIGIYFTVNNMGDVEANAKGVPRAIIAIVFYVIAVLCVMVSAFFNTVKEPTTLKTVVLEDAVLEDDTVEDVKGEDSETKDVELEDDAIENYVLEDEAIENYVLEDDEDEENLKEEVAE